MQWHILLLIRVQILTSPILGSSSVEIDVEVRVEVILRSRTDYIGIWETSNQTEEGAM